MNRLSYVVFVFFTVIILSGCSVQMAGSGKYYKGAGVVAVGQHRQFVVSELGEPMESFTNEGQQVDIYLLKRNNRFLSYTRAVCYTFLDVGTFGLWEIIGTPLETFIISEDKITLEYDQNSQLQKTVVESVLD